MGQTRTNKAPNNTSFESYKPEKRTFSPICPSQDFWQGRFAKDGVHLGGFLGSSGTQSLLRSTAPLRAAIQKKGPISFMRPSSTQKHYRPEKAPFPSVCPPDSWRGRFPLRGMRLGGILGSAGTQSLLRSPLVQKKTCMSPILQHLRHAKPPFFPVKLGQMVSKRIHKGKSVRRTSCLQVRPAGLAWVFIL